MVEKNVTRAVAAKRVERVDAVARREEAVVAELLTSGIPITNDASQRAVDHNLEDEFMTPEGSDEPTKRAAEVLDLDTITSIPKLPKATIEAILNTTNVLPPAIEISDDIYQERAHIWGKIQEAQQAGDEILVKYLMNASGLNIIKNKPPITRTVSATPVLLTLEPRMIAKSVKAEKELGLVHAIGAVLSHHDVGFTPFFDENIKALKAPLPLTIFNNEWKKRAIHAHINMKSSRSGESDKAYKGLAYPSEWTQTHSDWTNNHQNFYLTLRDVYGMEFFAARLLVHKEHCDAIAAGGYSFMTALRYDMAIRMTAFAHRITSEEGSEIQDISIQQQTLIEELYVTVRTFGEAGWKENCYALVQEYAHADPEIGVFASLARNQGRPVVFEGFESHHTPVYGAHQHYEHNSGYPSNLSQYQGFKRPGPQGRQRGFMSDYVKFGPNYSATGPPMPYNGDQRKKTRGYQGLNFIDGYVDKRHARFAGYGHQGAQPPNHFPQGAAPGLKK
ncbi:hypothetical protein PTTG_28936 [Puccinia triticina 1-1 BBBD Race 1]|uniref:Uncharacterized protein n=1 Tax=Puccinia triticina (isolate 1-1 / race 1 (BBBD)) TaxID=630390 RepID=A0A180G7X1_PUCT1|nr:hypothetical protein PTTG_28936 [Puccinia triticina 1-1 BBBD Race 1]